jgi:hypothetical protein
LATKASISARLFLALVLFGGTVCAGLPEVISGNAGTRTYVIGGDLQAAIDSAAPHDTLIIEKGIYEANPKSYRESICGNCGFAVWDSVTHGVLAGNIICANGWKEEWVCPCVGVWTNGPAANFRITQNDVWDNTAGSYEGLPDQTGLNGNISADPRFSNLETFELDQESPCIDAGISVAIDADGTRSDMGIWGGSLARPQTDPK